MELGRQLVATSDNTREFPANELLWEIADKNRTDDPLRLGDMSTHQQPEYNLNARALK
jgi:hypothetical protein